MRKGFVLFHIFLAILAISARPSNLTDRERLYKDLFANYDKRIRPVLNNSLALNVTVEFYLNQILDVNEQGQFMELYIWVIENWTDEFLGWDPDLYGGVEMIYVPNNQCWVHDLYYNNGLDMDESVQKMTMEIALVTAYKDEPNPLEPDSSGYWVATVYNSFPSIVRFTCSYNTKYFPFERQNCSLRYASWNYFSSILDLVPKSEKLNLEPYIENEVWELLGAEMRKEVELSGGENYTSLLADIRVKRKSRYYLINLIFPTLVISEIGILGFFTPSSSGEDRGEKINLGMTTLLALAVMLTLIADLMPPTSNYIPVISSFFIVVMLLICGGICVTCAIMDIERNGRKGKPLSNFLKSILCGKLPVIIGLRKPTDFEAPKQRVKTTKGNVKLSRVLALPMMERSEAGVEDPTLLKLVIQVAGLQRILMRMQERFEEDESLELIQLEWAFFAEFLDRVMLILFNLALILTTTVVLALAYQKG